MLKTQHEKKMETMAFSKWMRQKMGTVTAFIFMGSKITVDGDDRHEIKRHFLLGKKL